MRQEKSYKLFDDFLRESLEQDPIREQIYYDELLKARIAVEICQYRNKRGLTQEELAKKIGSTQPSIARMENISYGQYSIKTLKKLADALDLELIIGFKEKSYKEVFQGKFEAAFNSSLPPIVWEQNQELIFSHHHGAKQSHINEENLEPFRIAA